MNITKNFNVSKELLPYLETVLSKDSINYKILPFKDKMQIECAISGMAFHKQVENALCLKQKGNSRIPVLPYRIIKNPIERRKHGTVFKVLHKDRIIYENSYN